MGKPIGRSLHWLAVIILCAAGAWEPAQEGIVLVGLMLLLPPADRTWRPPTLALGGKYQAGMIAALLVTAAALLVWRPGQLAFAAATLLTAALPEEWFFRAYLMSRIGTGWGANVAASLVFSLLHGLTRGPVVAAQVFLPSLFFGWCFQRSGNLLLVVLVHALSNLVFVLFLAQWF